MDADYSNAPGDGQRKRRIAMFEDPIVEEVHAIRAQIAAECDHDFHKISERAKEFQKRFAAQIKTITKKELDQMRHRPAGVKPDETTGE